jgi:hypothetical protein
VAPSKPFNLPFVRHTTLHNLYTSLHQHLHCPQRLHRTTRIISARQPRHSRTGTTTTALIAKRVDQASHLRLRRNFFNHNSLKPHRSHHVNTFLQQGHSNTSRSIRQNEEAISNSHTQALTATLVALLFSAKERNRQIFSFAAISINT